MRAGHKERIAHLLEEMISQEENEHFLPKGESKGCEKQLTLWPLGQIAGVCTDKTLGVSWEFSYYIGCIRQSSELFLYSCIYAYVKI